jgi:hypothetical protein
LDLPGGWSWLLGAWNLELRVLFQNVPFLV